MTIYVVVGACGEHSDHKSWPVMAYTSEDAARAHVEAASVAYRLVVLTLGRHLAWPQDSEKRALLYPYDPTMLRPDYADDITYHYYHVECREAFKPLTDGGKR